MELSGNTFSATAQFNRGGREEGRKLVTGCSTQRWQRKDNPSFWCGIHRGRRQLRVTKLFRVRLPLSDPLPLSQSFYPFACLCVCVSSSPSSALGGVALNAPLPSPLYTGLFLASREPTIFNQYELIARPTHPMSVRDAQEPSNGRARKDERAGHITTNRLRRKRARA